MAGYRGCLRVVVRVCEWGCALVALVVSCGLAWGQGTADGAIAGRVVRGVGITAGGALVVVREVETGLTMRGLAGTRGEFLLARVPAGEYWVTAEDSGVRVTLEAPVRVGLGGVTEVEVSMRSGVGGVRTEADGDDELAGLSVEGWMGSELVAAGTGDGGEGEASFRGVGTAQNGSRTDGVSGEDAFGGGRVGAGVEEVVDAGSDVVLDRSSGVGSGGRSVVDGGRRAGPEYTFAQGAVREFRVEGQGDAAAYGSALYGHGVGGVVTAVSRTGGTKLHGMAFYNVRESAWAAANPFSVASNYVNGVVTSAVVKPSDVRQQFGGRIGGPVPFGWTQEQGDRGFARMTADLRPRLFYFYAFDEQRRDFPAVSSPGYAGFYALTGTQAALLGNRGVTAAKTMVALNYLNSLTGMVARQADQTVNFGRLDWRPAGGSRVVGEYNRARWSSPGGARSGAVVDRGMASVGSSYGTVDSGVGRWVQMLRGGLSNELRVQYGRELEYETPQTPLAQEPAVGPGGYAPEVSIGPDGFVFGTPAALGQRAYPKETRFEVADVVAWVKGRHLVQFGGDLSLVQDYTDSLTNVEGTFSYDSGATGGKAGGLVDWITDYTFNVNAYPNGGCPSIVAKVHDFCFRSYAQSFGQQSLGFSTQEWAGFVQEDWRVAARLTLHLGLRYEYEFLPLPAAPNAALDAVFGSVGATSVYPEDRNNFGPRLGVAWEPFGAGRGTVKVGWGGYFGRLPGATIRAALLDTALAGSVTRVRITPGTETVCPQATTVGFGYACSYLTAPSGVVAATTSAVVFDRRFRLPEVQQGTLSVERRVGWGVVGKVGYAMNLDRQLPNSVDINVAASTGARMFQLQGGTGAVGVRDGETFVVPLYSARVSPSFGPVTDVVSNANATYHGLTVEARRGIGGRAGMGGVGRGLEFRVAWTWSKAIDFGQNSGATPRQNGQFDPFQVRYDKGLSALNFPHRVVGTLVWSPRLGGVLAGERMVRAVANGWSVAGIFSEASGRGYSYDILGGTRLTGGRESINGSGGSVVLPTVGRNTLRLPDSANVDVRVSRSFALGDGFKLRGEVQAFNVANHVNVSGVQQRAFLVGTAAGGVTPLVFQNAATVESEGLNVEPFGTFTAAGTSQARERQVEVGLRVEF